MTLLAGCASVIVPPAETVRGPKGFPSAVPTTLPPAKCQRPPIVDTGAVIVQAPDDACNGNTPDMNGDKTVAETCVPLV